MADETRRQLLTWLGAIPGLAWGLGAGGCTSDESAAEAATDDETSEACRPTGDDVEGPFYREGAPRRQRLAPEDEPGERLVIEGTVYGPNCSTSLAGVLLDVWHADANGEYHGAEEDYRLRGQLQTDEDGYYRFETVRPGHYPMGGTTRPAHVHFNVSAPDHAPLTTQLYFADDPHLGEDDPCGVCGSGDPTQIIELTEPEKAGIRWKGTFDLILGSA